MRGRAGNAWVPNSFILSTATPFSASLADPVGSSPLVAAMLWLQNTLLGTVALTVAILAVASVGFMMLTGRVNVRYGATVIGGCFILFGASSIVAGIQSVVSGGESAAPDAYVAMDVPPPPAVVIAPSQPRQNDPYAGASVPPR